jgi:membrane-associated phospholipid phosphatase
MGEIIWIKFSSFQFYYDNTNFIIYISIILFFYSFYLLYKKFRPDPKIMMAFLSACWMICYTGAALTLSYLAYTTDRPLITAALAEIDHSLGFYAPSLVVWFWQHKWLSLIFSAAYTSFLYQKPFTIIYLSLRGKIDHVESFMMQYLIAGFITICIGALFPAEGTYAWYHFTPNAVQVGDVERLYELRQNIVDLGKLNGIVEFPSFHTALSVIYVYAFRDENKFIFFPILLLNILLIFSCLSHGGHFLIDVIAGVAVAVIAIGIERVLFNSIKGRSFRKTNDMKVQAAQVLE